VFLLSDGHATWGDTRPAALARPIEQSRHVHRIYAYIDNRARNDLALLDLITHKAKGAVYEYQSHYDVRQARKDPVIYAHRLRNWRIIQTQADGASDIILVNASLYVYNNQVITFVGRGLPKGKLRLTLQNGDTIRQHLFSIPDLVIETELTPRIYAEAAVRKLEGINKKPDELTIAYASHFRVPRNTMSLLMLESEKDYQNFNIRQHSDYSAYVRQHPVANLIQEYDVPVQTNESLYQLASLPQTQFDDATRMISQYTICNIPPRYLEQLDFDYLRNRPVIEHMPLQLDTASLRQRFVQDGQLIASRRDATIYDFAKRLRQRHKPLASLRLLSSIMESGQVNLKQRFMLADRLLQDGWPNESYFILRQYVRSYSYPQYLDTLIASLQQQNEPAFAEAIQKLNQADFINDKQALEP
jgi:hypothetical protein